MTNYYFSLFFMEQSESNSFIARMPGPICLRLTFSALSEEYYKTYLYTEALIL